MGAGGGGDLRTRRWGYRRGPKPRVIRNRFGRVAPVFFYSLMQVGGGLVPLPHSEEGLPPKPSALLISRLLHTLTCLVELCGHCPGTAALASDLLGFAWLLRS
ncbi:unnamed protein product, partial [Choristocarpus tenellus]